MQLLTLFLRIKKLSVSLLCNKNIINNFKIVCIFINFDRPVWLTAVGTEDTFCRYTTKMMTCEYICELLYPFPLNIPIFFCYFIVYHFLKTFLYIISVSIPMVHYNTSTITNYIHNN